MTTLRLMMSVPGLKTASSGIVEVRQLLDESNEPMLRPWRATRTVPARDAEKQGNDFANFDLPSGGQYQITFRLPKAKEKVTELSVREGAVVTHVEELGARPGAPRVGSAAGNGNGSDGTARTAPAPRVITRRGTMSFGLQPDRYEPPVLTRLSFAAEAIGGGRGIRRRNGRLTWSLPAPPPNTITALFAEFGRSQDAGWELPDPEQEEGRFPRWVGVFDGDLKSLVSVPWAWWGAEGPGPDEGFKLNYDASAESSTGGGATVLRLADTRWGALLDFAVEGRLDEAYVVFSEMRRHEAEEALHGKRRSPLAAVLGGLLLVGRDALDNERDEWLENLHRWNPGLSDAAILLGYRRLQLGRRMEGRELLYQALRTGIPYFAASVRMLQLGLAQLEDDEELDYIGPVAARVDPGQAFTVLRL